MKQKISYNSILSGLSIAFFVVFVAIFVLFWVFINKPFDNIFFWILFGLFCLGIIWICGSIPYSVNGDDDYISEESSFSKKKYRFSEIKSAQKINGNQYSSINKGLRLHGKFKNPVLITLKDGTQFIIGSENPNELVEYINSKIS